MRMIVVGSPAYFDNAPIPMTPHDLTAHNCINIRLPTYGTIYGWEFEKNGHEIRVRVEGQMIFNNMAMRMDAVLNGLGLAYMPEDQVLPYIAAGRLCQVLDDWCQPFSGYHLYYPNRRHPTPAFSLFVDAVRYRSSTSPRLEPQD
jgi:DNA-binding transcriptional LysR family regulator